MVFEVSRGGISGRSSYAPWHNSETHCLASEDVFHVVSCFITEYYRLLCLVIGTLRPVACGGPMLASTANLLRGIIACLCARPRRVLSE